MKDLSLKYGILPERVKAIVFQKHLYWEEIYPRLGETHMRAAFERELMYGAEFPFMDYGIDLKEMAKREKESPWKLASPPPTCRPPARGSRTEGRQL